MTSARFTGKTRISLAKPALVKAFQRVAYRIARAAASTVFK
jgi:hypothetical protein